MTPSEIADALGKAEVYDVADCDHDFGELLLDAAATIRELEAHLKTEERGHTETLKALGEKAVALKIATDALEPLVAACEAEFCSDKTEGGSFTYGEADESEVSYPASNITFGQIRTARKALARIKELT